ncbi:LysR family transcriptional regulator ArgP [Primorskyibacter aestuariivivens]|uniref:LysR family transcriptional regulator ArgP n=1 Tax=Primorskyibacter aestuariivivens TaxID=1888912 RepID=UPI0022FFEFCD|nr:LysR family transcriptional regulator ArgP [Primorskyibacter aestuariivivens]MDA7427979.1 LysR family transcriptional regulator ArgP [Primorskyibacter aestuariivivens]
MQLDPSQLAALVAVLRHGSFDHAAAALHVTPSAISQRIRALEDRVGTTLIIRSSPARATEAGARLARHATELSLLEADLARDLSLGVEPGKVRLAVTADSLATFVIPALAQVTDLLYEIVVDDQAHSADWLRRGEVSAAITDHAHPIQGCDCHPLGTLRYLATASPDYIALHFPDGVTPEALTQAPMLRFSQKDRLQHDWLHQLTGRRLLPPCHDLPSPQGFVEAARRGLGWGLNPEIMVRDDIARGALVAFHRDLPMDTPLYWQVRRAVAPALEALTRAMRRAASDHLI